MKLIDLFEASFTPKNFPGDINPGFSGAGERTDYVNNPQYNQTQGFPLIKDVKVHRPISGHETLSKGQEVFITRPGKLYKGVDIDAKPATGVFAQVGIKSADENDAVGWIPISAIQKPAGAKQSRVAMGSSAQDQILELIRQHHGEENVEFISSAPPGSTKPDLVISVNGEIIQFEIKGANKINAPITFFDKSARRGVSIPELDELAQAYTGISSFEEMIDQYRKTNKAFGYPGDKGAPKSGKLPPDLSTTDKDILASVRRIILEHLWEGGDNYFVVYDRTNHSPYIFFTGKGKNILQANKFPNFKKASLKTYGGPSAGAMRVGFKVQLEV